MLFPTRPLDVIDFPADSRHHGGLRRYSPLVIVLHATGGVNSLDWLTRSPQSDVSSHRLITKGGLIYKLVADELVAHTQGYGNIGRYRSTEALGLNDIALSIELENMNTGRDPYPEAQLVACAHQVHEWYGKYGLLPVLSHALVDGRKNDPLGFPWRRFHQLQLEVLCA
jgi:N-acetylmuramoyl-L-alanine amidase